MRKADNETKTVVIERKPKEAPLQRSVLQVHTSTAALPEPVEEHFASVAAIQPGRTVAA